MNSHVDTRPQQEKERPSALRMREHRTDIVHLENLQAASASIPTVTMAHQQC